MSVTMKKNYKMIRFLSIFLLFVCSYSYLFGQSVMDVSVWTGDLSKFKFTNSSDFSLDDSAPSAADNVSYVSLPFVFGEEDWNWFLDMKLNFELTTTCFVEYWLVSDNPDLKKTANGLYISTKDKRLSLFLRVDGKDFLYVRTPAGFLMMNPSVFSLKSKIEKGVLEASVSRNGGAMTYWAKDIPVTLNIDKSAYSGIVCKYPSGRSKSFHFTNWELEQLATLPPTDKPQVSIDIVNAYTSTDIRIDFSEPVNAAQATFQLKPTDELLKCNTKGTERYVDLVAKNHLESGVRYDLIIKGLKNENNEIVEDIQANFYYNMPGSPDIKNVVISEIMANPKGVTGLPEVEYIELFNNEDQSVNLQNWTMYYGEKQLKIPAYILPGKSYIVLGKKSAIDQLGEYHKVSVPNFPVLANIGNIVHIEDDQKRLTSWVDYSIDWHDANKKQGGFSLEVIDPANKCGTSFNWKSSGADAGGTPGKQNSVYAENPDTVLPRVLAIDLIDDQTLEVTFAKSMDYRSIADIDKYQVLSDNNLFIEGLRIPYPKSDHLLLQLSASLMPGDSLFLEMEELKCNGGFVQPAYTDKNALKVIRVKDPEAGDIVISELLFYPHANEAEFIELYNRSGFPVRTADLILATVKSDGTPQYLSPVEEDKVLNPQSYLLVTKDFESIQRKYDVSLLELLAVQTKLPAYANTGGTALLLDKNKSELDRFEFSPKLHTVAVKEQQGVSLERISFEKETNDKTNWRSSPAKVKYATPGYANSKSFSDENNDSTDVFTIDVRTKVFRPLHINEEEGNWILEYNIPHNPMKLSLSVFDAKGTLVKDIIRNKECLGNDRLLWDGTDNKGSIMSIGVYVVLLEYITPKGNLERKKWVTTLTN